MTMKRKTIPQTMSRPASIQLPANDQLVKNRPIPQHTQLHLYIVRDKTSSIWITSYHTWWVHSISTYANYGHSSYHTEMHKFLQMILNWLVLFWLIFVENTRLPVLSHCLQPFVGKTSPTRPSKSLNNSHQVFTHSAISLNLSLDLPFLLQSRNNYY